MQPPLGIIYCTQLSTGRIRVPVPNSLLPMGGQNMATKLTTEDRGAALQAHTWDGASPLSNNHSHSLKNARHVTPKSK